MNRFIVALAAALLIVACTNSPPSAESAEPERECRYHGGAKEVGCIYDAPELAGLTGLKGEPVWVFDGIPHKQGDDYLLRVSDDPGGAFIVLEVAAFPVTAAELGLDPLVGWKTRVVGRYTSSDMVDPKVPGASGTLVAVRVGFLYDVDRPLGPYENFRSKFAERLEKAKAGG